MKKLVTEKWKSERQEKVSLSLYRKWRKEIGGQELYDHSEASTFMFKCRINKVIFGRPKTIY